MEEFYAADFFADYAFTDWGVGIEGVKVLATSVRVGLPDYREEIKLLIGGGEYIVCLLYTSPSPRDRQKSRMPSSA